MAAPYLIVGLAGDSNGMWGKFRDTTIDVGHSRIFAYTMSGSVVAAAEPLANASNPQLGYGEGDGHKVGSTLALCRLLIERGHLPDGFDILIVPHCWAGTAFLNFWATTGSRFALDGGGGDPIGFLAHMNNAVATHASNRVWFFDWNHGANDIITETAYRDNMIATWGEIRSTVSTASNAPILVSGIPPNHLDPTLGNDTHHAGVIAAQQKIAYSLANSIYVDPTGLTAIDNTNDYIHHTAAAHRGGLNNAPGGVGEIMGDSLAERKYRALAELGVLDDPRLNTHVAEVGMALPHIIYLRARDQEIGPKGHILELASPDSGGIYTIQLRDPVTGGAGSSPAYVIGQKNGVSKHYLRFADPLPTKYVDRSVVDIPENWTIAGFAGTVQAVHRITRPFDQGFCVYTGTSEVHSVTMEHEIFLVLSTSLPQGGPYQISVTGNSVPTTHFVFHDKFTRAVGITGSQVGWRPEEVSKKVRHQLWINGFGTEGQIDLVGTYGLSTIQIIDEDGNVVATGTLSEVFTPTTAETGIANTEYSSSTTPPKVVTAVTVGNPTTMTIVGHGFSSGQRKFFRGFAGLEIVGGVGVDENFLTITVVDVDTFTVPVNMTGRTWNQNTYLAGFRNLVYDVYAANRFATYVHEWDHSAHTTVGKFRYRIPGLGVSFPYEQDAAVRYREAKVHMQGIYNQLGHFRLRASIGGWERPADYIDGVNGVEIYESSMVSYFSHETGVASGTFQLTSDLACDPPYITTNRVTGFAGPTIRDAGDRDFHSIRHCPIAYNLLELGYRQLPSGSRNIHWGFPKAPTFLDRDLYAGTEVLGDQVHMALAQLDIFRRFQKPAGRTIGGMQYTINPGGGGSPIEPSHISAEGSAILADDPRSAMAYAVAAFKMAQVFGEQGFTNLRNVWEASAVAAFDWSDDIYQDYLANGPTGSLVQGYFVTELGFKADTGWSDTTFANAMAELFNNTYRGYRLWAIATRYNLTDDTQYGDQIANATTPYEFGSTQTGISGSIKWEFVQPPSAVNYTTPQSHVNYYNARWALADETRPWGEWMWGFFKSSQVHSNTHLQYMRRFAARQSGMNLANLCWTTGLGTQQPLNTLVRDREAMGIKSRDIPGITVYFNRNMTTQGGTLVFNFSSDSPINWTVEVPTGTFETSYGTKRIITPQRRSTPVYRAFWDNTYNIDMTEYTSQESIQPRLIMAIAMHAFDGNTVKQATPGMKFRRKKV